MGCRATDRVASTPVAVAAPVVVVAAAATPPTAEQKATIGNDGPSDDGCSQRRSTAKAACSVPASPSRGELRPVRLAPVSAMSRVALCCVVDMVWLIVKCWSILTRTLSILRLYCPCYFLFIRPKTALGG